MNVERREELERFHKEELDRSARFILGRYSVAQATIHLSDWIEVFREDGTFDPDANPNHVAVLLHEYLHYLHNYSTLVGVEQTVATIAIAMVFGRTLQPMGGAGSRGDAALTEPEKDLFLRLLTARDHFVGSKADASPYARATSLSVVRWTSKGGALDVFFTPELEVEVSDGKETASTTLRLSPYVLEESLAAIWERLYLRSQGVSFPPSSDPYPYEIAGWVARHFHPDLEDEDVFRLGCVALNATNPGEQFMLLLQEELSVLKSEDFLDRIGWADIFPAARAQLFRKLDEIESAFVGRGLADFGLRSTFNQARALLNRRLTEPWFELQDGAFDVEAANELVRTTVPCEVVQARLGDRGEVGRDHILTFGNDTARNVEGRRVVQLLVHATQSHGVAPGGFAESDKVRAKCPYFTSCTHARRSARPDLCESQPWISCTPQGLRRSRSADPIEAGGRSHPPRPRAAGY